MFVRSLLLGSLVVAVLGCGHTDDSYILGTWSGPAGITTMKLTTNSDSSFSLSALKPIKGRWQLDGNDLKLFRDISDGEDQAFGTQGDGAYHFTVAADHKTLSGLPINGVPTILTKQ